MNSLRELLNKRTHCPFCNEKLIIQIDGKTQKIKISLIDRLWDLSVWHWSSIFTKYEYEKNYYSVVDGKIVPSSMNNPRIKMSLNLDTFSDYSKIHSSCAACSDYLLDIIFYTGKGPAIIREYFIYDKNDQTITINKDNIEIEEPTVCNTTYTYTYIPGDFLFKYDDPQLLRTDMEKMKAEQDIANSNTGWCSEEDSYEYYTTTKGSGCIIKLSNDKWRWEIDRKNTLMTDLDSWWGITAKRCDCMKEVEKRLK